ncbi:hypothetical protein VYU27_009348 [Nannochloropsis oceanica]
MPRLVPWSGTLLPVLSVLAVLFFSLPVARAWRTPLSSNHLSLSTFASSRRRAAAAAATTTTITTSSTFRQMHPWTRCFAVFPDDDELRSSNEGRGSGGGGGGGGQGPDEEQRSGSDIVMVDMTEDGKPPRVTIQASYSATDDLAPVITTLWKGIVLLDREGTSRRAAQNTILSVGALGLGSLLLFLLLLPAGFIHGPTDSATVNSRPTFNTRTYINPDQVLEEDFYRAGGVRLWEDEVYDDEDF